MSNASDKGMVSVPREQLEKWRRDLDACQKVIWLRGGFDPAYCKDAQDCLKGMDTTLAKPAAHHQGEPVAWTANKPTATGAYWIRGNGLEREALIEVVEDESELRCNLHQRTTESDFGYGYSIDQLSNEFEWCGPLYRHPTPALAH